MQKHSVAINESGRHGISKLCLRASFHCRKSSSSEGNSLFSNSRTGRSIEGPVDRTFVVCAMASFPTIERPDEGGRFPRRPNDLWFTIGPSSALSGQWCYNLISGRLTRLIELSCIRTMPIDRCAAKIPKGAGLSWAKRCSYGMSASCRLLLLAFYFPKHTRSYVHILCMPAQLGPGKHLSPAFWHWRRLAQPNSRTRLRLEPQLTHTRSSFASHFVRLRRVCRD